MSDGCYSDRLKATLLARLPGAGSAAVELEMGNAAHEFFLESGAWHEIIYANMIADRTRYELWPDTGRIGFITDLTIDGHGMTPVSGNSLAVGHWRGHFQVMNEFGTIEIYPAPTQTKPKAIVANVTVVPQDCSCEVPEDVLNHYYEALLDNALGKLYSHVGKPYTNASLAMFHTSRYRAHLTRARRIVAGGNVRASGPWLFPQIAPGHNRRGLAFPRGT